MLKEKTWRTPNRMEINTGHCTFDSQADLIITGNAITHVQLSSYVRPHTDIECNGFKRSLGHLRQFDLKNFGILPMVVLHAINQRPDQMLILYRFHHRIHRQLIVHGYVLTDDKHRLIDKFYVGPTYKSRDIIATVIPYIAEV